MCDCPHHPFGCYGHPDECECAKPDRSRPWVEFGAGWAKVHFGRELTDHDRSEIAAAVRGLGR